MSQPPSAAPGNPTAASGNPTLDSSEHAVEVRRILHDMNNGLEIIIQASYLMGTLEISADGKQWLKLLEQGVDQVTTLNARLRDLIIRQQQI